ncbi:MAG TPA: fibronectin type III domain-containing protein [Thermomicrobiales bacterium]|nr:fibronectin type III domain-containing protein [Thermomicrobiales bacterium]
MRRRKLYGVITGLVLLGLGAALAPLALADNIAYPTFADPAFQKVWERYDRPVYYGDAVRSYTWGAAISQALTEPYQEGPSGQHTVQYFEKSRMEINNPSGDRNDPFFVTQGLLAEDMIYGRIQVGNNSFQPAAPAQIPFGDVGDTTGPTYASLSGLIHAQPVPAGEPITATINRAGQVGTTADSKGVTSVGVVPGGTNHSIASIFYTYLVQSGVVYENGQNVTAPLYNPTFYVTGLPITEAYWATVTAAGQPTLVLIQCFERRCLTYTPSNPQGFQVEQANTGLQYYNWRYKGGAPGPSPSPSPSPGAGPAISGVSVVSTTTTSATIAWTTDRQATSEVDYGTTAQYDRSQADLTPVTSHRLTIVGLLPAQTYHFAVVSVDSAGNRSAGSDLTFTTQGPTWSAWTSRGGVLTDAPAATSFNNAVYVFGRSTDNQVYVTSSADGATWTTWKNLGGLATAPVSAAVYKGTLYVYARGSDNALYVASSADGSTFSGWTNVGGSLLSGPAATVLNGTLFVVARGSDNNLYIRHTTDGATYTAWQNIGASQTGNLAATTFQGRIYVFATGADNQVYVTSSADGATFGAWQGLGGLLTAAPAATVYTPASGTPILYVFTRGADGGLYERHTTDGSSWTDWQSLGGQLVGAPAAASANGVIYAFAWWNDNALWERHATP